jgi:hypothetical protein
MFLKEVESGAVNWIQLAQDRDQWQAFVKMGVNLRVP